MHRSRLRSALRFWTDYNCRGKIFCWIWPCAKKSFSEADYLCRFLCSCLRVFVCCLEQNWALFLVIQSDWIVVLLIWCMRYWDIHATWLWICSILCKQVSAFMLQKWLYCTILLFLYRSLLIHWWTSGTCLMWIVLNYRPWLQCGIVVDNVPTLGIIQHESYFVGAFLRYLASFHFQILITTNRDNQRDFVMVFVEFWKSVN